MKIENDKINNERKIVDWTKTILDLEKKYRNIFQYQIGENIFIYRTINRKEWHQVCSNKNISNLDREEIICKCCTLIPEDFDFDECDAGLPSELASIILRNSFLDSTEHRKEILNYYRQDMFNLNNQINCIINEAFPQIDIEEIEEWDIEKTAKYLASAEWKLVNLRGAQIKFDPMENTKEPPKKGKNKQKNSKQKMSPEKLAALRRKYPELDWSNVVTNADEVKNDGDVSSIPPGLRPGF